MVEKITTSTMKKLLLALTLILTPLTIPSVANAQAVIVSEDGQFLGNTDPDPYNAKSICNRYGTYGSDYGNTIFSQYGTYGSRYQANGVFNPKGKKPPKIIDISNGRILGRVTINTRIRNSYHPEVVRAHFCEQ
jgi:hypothetical protein